MLSCHKVATRRALTLQQPWMDDRKVITKMRIFVCFVSFLVLVIGVVVGVAEDPSWEVCGCLSCLDVVWNANAGGPTCGDRITWLMEASNVPAYLACKTVAVDEFPNICGPCFCGDGREEEVVVIQQGQEETPPESGTTVGDNGGTPSMSTENVPSTAITTESAPAPAPTATENTPSTGTTTSTAPCGCDACDMITWNRDAGGYSCGDRIQYLTQEPSKTQKDACRQVGGVEFPGQCGACACNDNNDSFGGGGGVDAQQQQNDNSNLGQGEEVTQQPHQQQQQEPQAQQFTPPEELYCFPPSSQRTRYANMWGNYILEVKEDDDVCGPSDNFFSKNGVKVDSNSDLLMLEFGKRNGRWHASEVRILLPPSQYYDYGRYAFSVKSVQVMDTTSQQVVANVLPPSMILGLFTWDDTEDYAIRENFLHEVDIEISRWDSVDNADAQFLVQPPGLPQKYRFYTGGSDNQNNKYQQAPHIYQFQWDPACITWYSDAGGGHSFTYSTETALAAGQPDYTQCMPAQVEVRINLWNLLGSWQAPTDMEDTHVVQVVIDKFEYVPSGLTGVPEGGVCSKDCHCDTGLPSLSAKCINNQCVRFTTVTSSLLNNRDPTSGQYPCKNNSYTGLSSWQVGCFFLSLSWGLLEQVGEYFVVCLLLGIGQSVNQAKR